MNIFVSTHDGSSACTQWKQHIASGYTWLLHVKPGLCYHFPGLCINRSQHLASGYTWLLLGSTSAAILLCVMHLWRETWIICVSRHTENNSATCASTYLPRWICTLCLALLAAQAVTRCASRQWLRAHAALWPRHAAGRRLHIYVKTSAGMPSAKICLTTWMSPNAIWAHAL